MLRDRQQPVDKLVDKLAPKVQELQQALKGLPAEEIAWRSGAVLDAGQLHLEMLFQPYVVDVETFVVSKPGCGPASSFHQSLVLTYLQTANGAASADRWISFRELPNGAFYHRAFQGYAPDRLSRRWQLDLDGFIAACRVLQGRRLELGNAGFAFQVLPRIDLAAVYWLGDEDFPSRAALLFDANAHHYMVTDGLAILGSHLVGKLLAAGDPDGDADIETAGCC
jgi:hypothetical protein